MPKTKEYRLGGWGCNTIKRQKGLLCWQGLYWWEEWRNTLDGRVPLFRYTSVHLQ